MKKFLIILTFLFVSIFAYSDSAISYSKSVNIDFDVRVMMGLTKIEENDNPKYKKFLDYIDENLAKKGEVKYSANISLKKASTEVFSENGELLYEEKLPKEFMNILNYSLATADDKAKVKKFIKGSYEKPAYMIISKNNGKPKIFIERSMEPDEHKIKTTTEVTLKRELTEAEKKELLSLKNDKLITKYKSYVDSEISKAYTDNNLTMVQEFKNLTETSIVYIKNNESIKEEIKYIDNTLSNGTIKSYKNDKLVEEIVFENSMPNLQKSYHDNGNLAFEIPMKNGAINGEVKIYYENGKIKEIIPVKNGKKEGIGREYNETGKIIKEVLYKDDEEVKKIK